jgi:hypothetical protein
MFDERPDRGPPTCLRGWLSDVYLPALLDKTALEPLARRLGGRATVDDPLFGREAGLPGLERYVNEASAWLLERDATWEKTHFTTGVDRDVTEGLLALNLPTGPFVLPVAVVAERRRSREVEVRLYYSTYRLKEGVAPRGQLVPKVEDLVLPAGVNDHLDALRAANVDALLAGFEQNGVLREAQGTEHAKGNGLRAYFEKLVLGGEFGGGVEIMIGGAADDGRTVALEYTLVRMGGHEVKPQAGLTVYERGDSGLLRAVRMYDDLPR